MLFATPAHCAAARTPALRQPAWRSSASSRVLSGDSGFHAGFDFGRWRAAYVDGFAAARRLMLAHFGGEEDGGSLARFSAMAAARFIGHRVLRRLPADKAVEFRVSYDDRRHVEAIRGRRRHFRPCVRSRRGQPLRPACRHILDAARRKMMGALSHCRIGLPLPPDDAADTPRWALFRCYLFRHRLGAAVMGPRMPALPVYLVRLCLKRHRPSLSDCPEITGAACSLFR